MDAHEQIAAFAEISAGVLGDAVGNYILCPLDGEGNPLSEAQVHEASSKGFFYVGVLGFCRGTFGYKAEPGPVCAFAMLRAAMEFPSYVASRLQPKDDSVSWCERLMQLPDMRDEFRPME